MLVKSLKLSFKLLILYHTIESLGFQMAWSDLRFQFLGKWTCKNTRYVLGEAISLKTPRLRSFNVFFFSFFICRVFCLEWLWKKIYSSIFFEAEIKLTQPSDQNTDAKASKYKVQKVTSQWYVHLLHTLHVVSTLALVLIMLLNKTRLKNKNTELQSNLIRNKAKLRPLKPIPEPAGSTMLMNHYRSQPIIQYGSWETSSVLN